MNKSILYIGNNINYSQNKHLTTMEKLSNSLEKEGYHVQKVSQKVHKFSRLFEMIFSVIKHKNAVDYILIDTYSTFNFYYAFVISQLARFYKIKYIPILHGGNLPKRLLNSKKKSDLLFKNSYKNIAPSNYLKSEFEKKGYKVELIPNIISIEDYHFKEREIIQPKLLYVRAFASIYNPTLAIKVLKEVQKKYPKANLCMIGPDRDGTLSEVKELISKYKLENSVEITGVLSKEKWHKKSEDFDIFINTTNIDNTPISVIEAMALGLPIVSTDVGGIPYLIKDGNNGLLVEKDNVDKMVKAICNLIDKTQTQMILNARKTAESFSWEVVKHKWFKILK